MTTAVDKSGDALCAAARDISRHVAGLADELLSLRHASTPISPALMHQHLNKLRDQVTLLNAVVEDIARAEAAGV